MRIWVLARGWFANPALTNQLPNNAHLSGGILANANRLDAVFEFPPTPFPVNHWHEAIESRRHRFWSAVPQPHAEPCWMFPFIGAGGWSAHLFILLANPALEVLRVLPIGRNWASNHLAKIQL